MPPEVKPDDVKLGYFGMSFERREIDPDHVFEMAFIEFMDGRRMPFCALVGDIRNKNPDIHRRWVEMLTDLAGMYVVEAFEFEIDITGKLKGEKQ